MSDLPRVSFGMIVLNGEPFLPYNLRALYPFAHEIIVVEGAAPAASAMATSDGHSTDGTLSAVRRFQHEEDPEDKVTLVTAQDEGHANGFWPGEKHEQSRAYASRVTGDWLWQVDVDEFYQPEGMRCLLAAVDRDPSITGASFRMTTFWGGFDLVTDGWYLRRGAAVYHRLFRWAPGYTYATHRPPTVLDDQGRDLRELHWLDDRATRRLGCRLYHYSLVFPSQVSDKCRYYAAADWAASDAAVQWAESSFLELGQPYRVHNVYALPSWLERFDGKNPPQIEALQRAIASGTLEVSTRPAQDADRLVRSPVYRAGIVALKLLDYVDRIWRVGLQPGIAPLGRAVSVRARRILRKGWRVAGQLL